MKIKRMGLVYEIEKKWQQANSEHQCREEKKQLIQGNENSLSKKQKKKTRGFDKAKNDDVDWDK